MGRASTANECRAFTRDPELIAWDCDTDTSSWSREEERDLLSVIYYGAAAMLGFGNMETSRYSLDVRLRQPIWTGLGLFFGYQTIKGTGIQFQTAMMRFSAQQYTLGRYLIQQSDNVTTQRTLGSEVILPKPSAGDQWLVIESAKTGLVRASWNGADRQELTSPSANSGLSESDYLGRYGTVQLYGAATFHHFFYTCVSEKGTL